MFKEEFAKILVWWRLVLIQLIGVAIILLIPKIGIDQLMISLVGTHSDISGYVFLIFVVLPGLIAWYWKVKGWWIPILLMLIPLVLLLVGYIVLMQEKYSIM